MLAAFMPRDWRLIALGLAVAIIWVQEVRVSRAQADASAARAALASDRATYASAAASAEKAARVEESRREAEKLEITRHAQEQTAAAEAAARDAGRAAAGLRQQVATLIGASRRPAADSGTAAGSPPATDALDLLAGMLERHSQELVEVGEFADRSRIAGLACERAYDSLITSSGS